jgi:hypothetical protein
LYTGVTKSALTAGSIGKWGVRAPFGASHLLHYELGNTISWLYELLLTREIDQDNPDLSAIIGIYGPRAIKAGNPLL